MFTGERERKDHIIFECLGAIDEMVSHLGVYRVEAGPQLVEELQKNLFKVSALIASDPQNPDYPEDLFRSWDFPARIRQLEQSQKSLMEESSPPERFIIPGEEESRGAALLDVARAVCRRAERNLVSYRHSSGRKDLDSCLIYLNRASDYLFVAARWQGRKDQRTGPSSGTQTPHHPSGET